MASLNGLPVFFIKIDESLDSNQGIDFVSCVDYPAIESNFVALSNVKKFAFNADKQMLYGAILIPNQPIYRNDPKLGEYYAVFKEEEIVKMVRKFQAQQKTVNLNYQHQKDSQLKNAVIQEIWLTGKSDKSQDLGFDFPVNTAVIGAYIGDTKFWNEEVKTGNVRGFSIEGFLDMEMKKLNKYKFMEAKTKDGQYTISTTSEAFADGSPVVITAADGTTVTEGTFELDNGVTITVTGGVITEMADPATTPELSAEETAVIQSAMKSQFDALTKRIEELEIKLSQKPGATPITDKQEETPKPTKLQFIRNIVTKHNEKK